MEVYIKNATQVRAFFQRLTEKLNRDELLIMLGYDFEKDVKQRIRTRNYGQWPAASKWIRAKKGTDKALTGVERFVKYRLFARRVEIISETPGNWGLTQHHTGFQNKLYTDKDKRNGTTVTIDLVNPQALPWVKGNRFSWKPKRRGKTPARKIWPDQAFAEYRANLIASRWVAKAVREAGGVILR